MGRRGRPGWPGEANRTFTDGGQEAKPETLAKSIVGGEPMKATVKGGPMKAICVGCVLTFSLMAGDPLEQRIGRNDESKWHVDKPTHLGTGELHYQVLLGRGAIYGLNFNASRHHFAQERNRRPFSQRE
jgi:hypothetical protein